MINRSYFILRSNLLLLTACSLFATLLNGAETIELFNGKNLKGWHAYLSEHGVTRNDVWSVKDGLLICKGEPMGYLYTDKAFENFKLMVEWRWAPGKKAGNSGVLMRINGEPRPLPRCFEAQLQSGNAGALFSFHGMLLDGDPNRKIERVNDLAGEMKGVKKIKANEHPVGEWNRYEIVFNGTDLTVWINGEKINQAVDCDTAMGPIGLQSEGGEIHFRKVELTPLD